MVRHVPSFLKRFVKSKTSRFSNQSENACLSKNVFWCLDFFQAMASTTNFDDPDATVNISVETQVPKECVKLDLWLGQGFLERCPRGAEEFPEQLSPELTFGEEIGKCCTLVFAVSGHDKYLSFQMKLLSTGLPHLAKSRNDTVIYGSMVVMLKDDKGELLEAPRLLKFVLDSGDESQKSCGWTNFIKIEDLWMNRAVGSECQLLFDIMISIHGEPRTKIQAMKNEN